MTNLEYYGLENIEFREEPAISNNIILNIAYNAKHSKEPITLKRKIVVNRFESIRDAKVKWLLEEHKFHSWFGELWNYCEAF